jgi:hypothetical protein
MVAKNEALSKFMKFKGSRKIFSIFYFYIGVLKFSKTSTFTLVTLSSETAWL